MTKLNGTQINYFVDGNRSGLPSSIADDSGAFPRQDGRYYKPFNFTAIGGYAVLDNITGLTWENKDVSGARGKDNTYTFADASAYVDTVNGMNLGGWSDWRLPSARELFGIVDLGKSTWPTINTAYFTNNASDGLQGYWTSDLDPSFGTNNCQFMVEFGDAGCWALTPDNLLHVRLVRGDIVLPNQFVVTDNGLTVTDLSTGLMWKREFEMLTPGSPVPWDQYQGGSDPIPGDHFTWSEALQLAVNDTTAGHTDWRLPNVKELFSFADLTRWWPTVDPTIFPCTAVIPGTIPASNGTFSDVSPLYQQAFWTSTPVTPGLDYGNDNECRIVEIGGDGSPGNSQWSRFMRNAKTNAWLVRDGGSMPTTGYTEAEVRQWYANINMAADAAMVRYWMDASNGGSDAFYIATQPSTDVNPVPDTPDVTYPKYPTDQTDPNPGGRNVNIYSPEISVILKKTVRNQGGKASRYTGGTKSFDLRPFLTEDSSVSISRQINAPSGSFQISVGDRGVMHDQTLDSLYGIAEPMDIVEIRMARDPHEYSKAGKLPLVFRGVISEVRRDESMGQDGKPRRIVVLAGQDWGKFLQIIQIRYIKGNALSEDWLSGIVMQTHFGINYGIHTAGTVISDLTSKVVNPFLARYGDSDIVPFLVDVSGVDPEDKVMPQGFNSKPGGTLWDYFYEFGDIGPFYEMFIDDTEQGPKLIYRKPPFFTQDGDLIYGNLPDSVNVSPDHVQRLTVSRSDADVANWFWIDPRRLVMMDGPSALWIGMGANPYNSFLDSPDTAKELYGLKFMEVVSHHGFMTQGAPAAQNAAEKNTMATYLTNKIQKLKLTNKDNAVFERGSMVLAGNEKVKIGTNVRIKRGKAISLYYAQSVTHTFQPFKSFITTVNFIRGTGFINRSSNDQLGIKAPYLEEIGHGPYEVTPP